MSNAIINIIEEPVKMTIVGRLTCNEYVLLQWFDKWYNKNNKAKGHVNISKPGSI